MSQGKKVFLIGSGLIGGEILNVLLEAGYDVSVLTRRQEAAQELEKLGAKPVSGTLDDAELITQETNLSDIVVHTATADHLPSVEAVLEGIEQRHRAKKETIYLHTSGAAVLDDASKGEHKTEKIFYDDKPEDIDALSDDAPHRSIDLAIVNASKRLGYDRSKLAVIMPPLVYGIGSKSKRLSIQLPTLTRFALSEGYVGHVGKGLSVTSQIHTADLARGYLTILKAIEAGTVDLRNPYFFCNSGEDTSWKRFAKEIGDRLALAGKIKDAEPRQFQQDAYHLLFGPFTDVVVAMNSRCRGERLKQLGWSPKEESVFSSLDKEIRLILQEKGHFDGYSAPVAS